MKQIKPLTLQQIRFIKRRNFQLRLQRMRLINLEKKRQFAKDIGALKDIRSASATNDINSMVRGGHEIPYEDYCSEIFVKEKFI